MEHRKSNIVALQSQRTKYVYHRPKYYHKCSNAVRHGFPPRPISGEKTLSIREIGVCGNRIISSNLVFKHMCPMYETAPQIKNHEMIQVTATAQSTVDANGGTKSVSCSSRAQVGGKSITKASSTSKTTRRSKILSNKKLGQHRRTAGISHGLTPDHRLFCV